MACFVLHAAKRAVGMAESFANKKPPQILKVHLVGPRGFEPLTSSTSRKRSSQLS